MDDPNSVLVGVQLITWAPMAKKELRRNQAFCQQLLSFVCFTKCIILQMCSDPEWKENNLKYFTLCLMENTLYHKGIQTKV